MEPLHIKISLGSPLAGFQEKPTYFDGFLTGVLGEKIGSLASSFDEALNLFEYLDHVEIDGNVIWKASKLVPYWRETGQHIVKTRRIDHVAYMNDQDAGLIGGRRKSYILSDSGIARNYFMIQPVRWASYVEAWVVGDKHALTIALSDLWAIGRERRNGYGIVNSVEVNSDPEAEQKWKCRPLPAIGGAEFFCPDMEYYPSYERVAPPYWQANNRTDCFVPMDL